MHDEAEFGVDDISEENYNRMKAENIRKEKVTSNSQRRALVSTPHIGWAKISVRLLGKRRGQGQGPGFAPQCARLDLQPVGTN